MLFIIQSVFEIALVGFIIWGVFNEQKLVDFEEKIKEKHRRRKLHLVEGGQGCAKKHCV